MKKNEQIELAKKIIEHLQDYVELAKVQKKLKVENVDEKIEAATEFVVNNVEKL